MVLNTDCNNNEFFFTSQKCTHLEERFRRKGVTKKKHNLKKNNNQINKTS